MFSVLADNQRWFSEVTGATFELNYPRSFTSKRSWPDIIDEANGDFPRGHPCGFNIWKIAMAEIAERLDICRDDWTLALYIFRPPLPPGDDSATGMGGMVGKENFGCSYDRPGAMADGAHKPWMACGVTLAEMQSRGWDIPWWGYSWGSIAGGMAHELCHCWGLPHTWDDPATEHDERYQSIMFNYWGYRRPWHETGENATLTAGEIEQLLASGALK